MLYTMENRRRDCPKEHFKDLTPGERRELLKKLSPDELLGTLSFDEIEKYLKRRKQRPSSRKPKKQD
jgi:hypothetical protein